MIRKIIGILLVLSGIGGFMGTIAKSNSGRSDDGSTLMYGLLFLIMGIVLLVWTPKQKTKDI